MTDESYDRLRLAADVEAERRRRQQVEEGQGESSGPSFSLDQALAALREQQRRMEMVIWRDGRGPLTATEIPIVSTPFYDWYHLDHYGRRSPGQTQPRNEIQGGEQMRFSSRPDPLTEREKAQLDDFYRKVLRDGYGQWPLGAWKVPLWMDGTMRTIYYDSRWSIDMNQIYIGASRDEGTGEFAQPAARLACVATLMGITGHSNRPDLIALLSEKLAKVMAGVYDSVVKPLAATTDAKPVRRMAWSASGGLASWCDGGWVGLTGEPVEVSEGWTVIDTEEGPIGEGLPPITTPRATVATRPGVGRSFEDMRRANNWITRTAADGRSFVHWMDRELAQENFDRVLAEGYPVEWIEDGRFYGIAPLRVAPAAPTMTHAGWEEVRGRFERWAEVWDRQFLPDGRVCVSFADSAELNEERINRYHLVGCVIERHPEFGWAITYPPEPPPDTPRRGYDELIAARNWGEAALPDGRMYIPIPEAHYRAALREGYIGIAYRTEGLTTSGIVRA